MARLWIWFGERRNSVLILTQRKEQHLLLAGVLISRSDGGEEIVLSWMIWRDADPFVGVRIFACMGRYAYDTATTAQHIRQHWNSAKVNILLGSRGSIIQHVNDATLNFSRGLYWTSGRASLSCKYDAIYAPGRQHMLQGEHDTIMQHVLQGELEVWSCSSDEVCWWKKWLLVQPYLFPRESVVSIHTESHEVWCG